MGVEATYDRVAAEYDAWVGEGSMLADATFEELVGKIEGQRVCSVACGQGREARYLASRGAQVTGVDLSESLVALARRHEEAKPFGISYFPGDAHTLEGLENESFDGAVCYMALMDIPDLDRAVQSVARVLRPGGWFVFVITHPCFKTPATGDLVDHVNKSARRTVGRYFDEGYWDGPGLHNDALPVGAHHRMLSTYVAALTRAGLVVDQLREPQQFDRQPVWREVPQLLYVRSYRSTQFSSDTGSGGGRE
ncbi:class I SAM-dependent methyltransferase [Kribbella qitaiheensis]|uniref:Class I SAM-dependent methyltransferase n=2 Tax=Kribbella qitaiheensis TaxID=1544730 RepID=A0A7G6X8J4_9ACTN|nr:class I SAM-dependent methyltransferase [Kribbella qitaiheensis]